MECVICLHMMLVPAAVETYNIMRWKLGEMECLHLKLIILGRPSALF